MGRNGSCGCSGILNDLYTTKGYSDLKILCNGFYFQAHRAVVCTQSEPLKNLLQGTAGSYKIRLDGLQPLIVAKIVEFLYTYDYSDVEYGYGQEYGARVPRGAVVDGDNSFTSPDTQGSASTSQSGDIDNEGDIADAENGEHFFNGVLESPATKPGRWPLTIHTKVYKAARRYKIPALEALVVVKYSKLLEREVWDVSDLVTSLQLLYVGMERFSTPLREKALLAASKSVERLVSHEGFTSLLKDNGDVGVDVLNSVLKTNQPSKSRQSIQPSYFYQPSHSNHSNQSLEKSKAPNVMSWLFSWAGKKPLEIKSEAEPTIVRNEVRETTKFMPPGTNQHPLAELYKKPIKPPPYFSVEVAKQRSRPRPRPRNGPSSWKDDNEEVEVRAPAVRAPEMRVPEMRVQEVKARSVKISETKVPHIKPREVRISEFKASDGEMSTEVKAQETRSSEVEEKGPEARPTEPESPGTKSPETKSPEARSPEARSPEARSLENKPLPEQPPPEPEPPKAKLPEVEVDLEKAPEDTLGMLTTLRKRGVKPPAYRTISMPAAQAPGFPWMTFGASKHRSKTPEETPSMYGFPIRPTDVTPKFPNVPLKPEEALLPIPRRSFRSSEAVPTMYGLTRSKDSIPTISRAQLEDIRKASRLKVNEKHDGIGSNNNGPIPTAGGLF